MSTTLLDIRLDIYRSYFSSPSHKWGKNAKTALVEIYEANPDVPFLDMSVTLHRRSVTWKYTGDSKNFRSIAGPISTRTPRSCSQAASSQFSHESAGSRSSSSSSSVARVPQSGAPLSRADSKRVSALESVAALQSVLGKPRATAFSPSSSSSSAAPSTGAPSSSMHVEATSMRNRPNDDGDYQPDPFYDLLPPHLPLYVVNPLPPSLPQSHHDTNTISFLSFGPVVSGCIQHLLRDRSG